MQRALILFAVVATLGGLGVTRVVSLERRLEELDGLRRELPARTRALLVELDEVHLELQSVQEGLRSAEEAGSQGSQSLERVRERLLVMERGLHEAADTIAQQAATIDDLEARASTAEVEARMEERWGGLASAVTAAATLAQQTSAELVELNADLHGPTERDRWRAMVGPTVQLAGATTVGSGVLLVSTSVGDDEWETLLLTSWHVVRDIVADSDDEEPMIPVAIYEERGQPQHLQAELLHYDVGIDAALLRLLSTERVECGATLPTRAQLASIRTFSPIYAVGCPLGNDPIPTRGDVSDLEHFVDGGSYWMISAPTYIGNSGGGIYDGRTHQLLGIFSKIYTHGSLRPTVVPHMGLVTPLSQIYDWLEESGYASVVPDKSGPRLVLPQPK